MKLMSYLTIVLLAACLIGTAAAQCPVSGWYRTDDGSLHEGRVTEAWCGADGAPVEPGQPGNMQNAWSYGGGPLGDMWKVWGMTVDANGPIETGSSMVDGTGWIDYNTTYEGGEFWLNHLFPWGAESAIDMIGSVTYYNIASRVSFVDGVMTGIDANLFMQGSFDECVNDDGDPRCFIEFTIANASLVWQSGWPEPAPDLYPEFLCDALMGELYHSCCITTVISCDGVATESVDWGSIKSLYR